MASKTSEKSARLAVLDSSMKGLFKKLQARPIPDHIRSVVDQLEAADIEPLKKSG